MSILHYHENLVGTPSPTELKNLIEQSLDADKGENIVTVDLDENAAIGDYIVVASGTSSKHVSSLARNLKDRLEKQGVKGIHIEGLSQSDWVVIDVGDIIVHLFRPEVREFYNIEKMWGAFAGFNLVDTQHTQISA